MPTAAELLRDKVDGLTDIPDSWVNRVTGIQPKIAARLTRLMAKLTTTNGVVDQTGANLRTITAILEDLRAYMTQGEYATVIGELNKDFIQQQATSTAYMTTLGGQGIETTFAAQTYAARRAQLVGQLVNGIDEAVLNPVFETLLTGIETKASYSDLLVSVTDSIVGTPNYDGRLLAYSRQLVTDTIGTTDRAFTEIIAADLGLEWYRYTGGLMDTTRCFCEKRNGKWYHKKEIESWGNKENLGECNTGKGWAGMNRATDSSTIFAYAGGYNCQHSILPVSEAAVPTDTLKEAIAKGFYKPDLKTRKLLGLDGVNADDGFKYSHTFTSPRGNEVAQYNIKGGGYARVEQYSDGYTINNVIIDESNRGKGYASNLYKELNAESVKATGKTLQSTKPDSSGLIELSKDGKALWERLVDKGLAKEIGENRYRFV